MSRMQSSEFIDFPATSEEKAILEQMGINSSWFSYDYFKTVDPKVGILANWVAYKYKLHLDRQKRQYEKTQSQKLNVVTLEEMKNDVKIN